MLKILVVSEDEENHIPELVGCKIVATIKPSVMTAETLQKYTPDFVLSSVEAAKEMYSITAKSTHARSSITASTHQGIQLVSLQDIYYFQAADKYVTAHHIHGELLIEDSINSLELEFSPAFIRVHRKTLVSIAKVGKLIRDDAGKHFIVLKDKPDFMLPVSRRQLPKVRKVLLCK